MPLQSGVARLAGGVRHTSADADTFVVTYRASGHVNGALKRRKSN